MRARENSQEGARAVVVTPRSQEAHISAQTCQGEGWLQMSLIQGERPEAEVSLTHPCPRKSGRQCAKKGARGRQGPGGGLPRASEVLRNLLSLSEWEAAEGSQQRIQPDFQGSALAAGLSGGWGRGQNRGRGQLEANATIQLRGTQA